MSLVTVDWLGSFWDSSQIPSATAPSSSHRILWIAVRGKTSFWSSDWRESIEQPCEAMWLREDAREGALGHRELFFRIDAPHYQRVELRVDQADLGPNAALHQRVRLPEELLPVLLRLLDETLTEPEAKENTHELITQLTELGHLHPRVASSLVPHESPQLTRLWRGISSSFKQMALHPSMKVLAADSGISIRQLGRDIVSLTQMLKISSGGFRATFLTLRLRFAIFMLNSGSLSIQEVATRAGYGSTRAMSHAFRKVGIEAPEAFAERGRHYRQGNSA